MRVSEITVGTVLNLIDGGGEYRVTRIEGEEIELESLRLNAGMDIYLSDLPEMFGGVSP